MVSVGQQEGGDVSELQSQADIDALTNYPKWAGTHVLRAMAALKGVDIISLRSDTVSTKAYAYPADGATTVSHMPSWQHEIAPRLRRQQQGIFQKVRVRFARTDGKGSERVWMPERPIVVVLYNGANHYNGTCRK